jgi:hypothetical protein
MTDTLREPSLELPGLYHNPGSISAVGAGCTCPTIDNRHGAGAYNGKPGEFWINGDCPLHGAKGKADDHTHD